MKQAKIEFKELTDRAEIVFTMTHSDKHGFMRFNEITIAQSEDKEGLADVFEKFMGYNTIDTNDNPQWTPKPSNISEAKLFINATAYALGVRLTTAAGRQNKKI